MDRIENVLKEKEVILIPIEKSVLRMLRERGFFFIYRKEAEWYH
jgi:hypothetical protein